MRIEESIVYLLATEGWWMSAETLAEQINLRRLHRRRDGQSWVLTRFGRLCSGIRRCL